MADRPSRRARFPLLRRSGQSGLSLLRQPLRSRLPGAASAPRSPPAAAASVRRPASPLTRLFGLPPPSRGRVAIFALKRPVEGRFAVEADRISDARGGLARLAQHVGRDVHAP